MVSLTNFFTSFYKIKNHFVLSCLFIYMLFYASSCTDNIGDAVEVGREAVNVLDKGINKLDKESTNWQRVLKETEKELAEDTQSTIRNEISNLATDTLQNTGVQTRCTTDFIQNRARLEVRQSLVGIRNEAAEKLNIPPITIEPVKPGICSVSPTVVDLNIENNSRSYLQIDGYDFDPKIITVFVRKKDAVDVDVTNSLANPSKYVLTLNLGSNGINHLLHDAQHIVIKVNNQDFSSISVVSPNETQADLPVSPPVEPPRWVSGSNGSVPEKAVEGGSDGGTPLYVCRFSHVNELHIGRLSTHHKTCFIGWGNGVVGSNNYEVLVASNDTFTWVPSSFGNVPEKAVEGGSDGGNPSYVCRFFHVNGLQIGRLSTHHKTCFIGWGNGVVGSNNYEVLVNR